jgi:hypothetical protein
MSFWSKIFGCKGKEIEKCPACNAEPCSCSSQQEESEIKAEEPKVEESQPEVHTESAPENSQM